MATYQKRGYKPKAQEEIEEVTQESSTTAEVFSTLDESASKSEAWVSQNQNIILGVIAVIAVTVLGYLGYQQWVQKPLEREASNELYYAQRYFDQALITQQSQDSLFTLALEGAEGKYGFVEIAEQYAGTKAADLAAYGAGLSYLHLGQFEQAVSYLSGFKTDDALMQALALGALGDAQSELGDKEAGLKSYVAAASHSNNEFSAPRFWFKAGVLAQELGQTGSAIEYFKTVSDQYPNAVEASSVDALLGSLQAEE